MRNAVLGRHAEPLYNETPQEVAGTLNCTSRAFVNSAVNETLRDFILQLNARAIKLRNSAHLTVNYVIVAREHNAIIFHLIFT